MTNFEKFVRTSRRYYGDPVATISKNKYISFNCILMEKYVKDNDYAVLYFDREKELIGVKYSRENNLRDTK